MFRWNRIVTGGTPGVASEDPACCHHAALDQTMQLNRFRRVFRASRLVTARGAKVWRDCKLINSQNLQSDIFWNLFHLKIGLLYRTILEDKISFIFQTPPTGLQDFLTMSNARST